MVRGCVCSTFAELSRSRSVSDCVNMLGRDTEGKTLRVLFPRGSESSRLVVATAEAPLTPESSFGDSGVAVRLPTMIVR